MVKLTPELIQQSSQYINPVRDRELILRGYKIPTIENLGATHDQFDNIDLSDNDIRKLDGFPLLKRLKSLLLNNNRICRIGENLQESLPHIETLVLTNNQIQELGDIDVLSTVKSLVCLSLMKNPVASKKHYRLYTIHKVPQLRLVDFRKVRQKEREEAARLFKGKKGKQLEREIGKRSRTYASGAGLPGSSTTAAEKLSGPTAADIQAIKEAIGKASTLEEVEKLNQMLKSGQIPGKESNSSSKASVPNKTSEEEEMETDQPSTNGQ